MLCEVVCLWILNQFSLNPILKRLVCNIGHYKMFFYISGALFILLFSFGVYFFLENSFNEKTKIVFSLLMGVLSSGPIFILGKISPVGFYIVLCILFLLLIRNILKQRL